MAVELEAGRAEIEAVEWEMELRRRRREKERG